MEEKRRERRLELDVSIELERLDQGQMTTLKMIHVDVTDLSSSGMGFRTSQPMENGALYDTRIKIWTNEVIQTVIRIVRCEQLSDSAYQCGATFVGLPSADALKINIYSMFNPEENE
ncbi:MAG: PilZ domain-containing protein [Eubacterium sp.]|nr:PilZ domain-containing protein [Eubacterium sp.]